MITKHKNNLQKGSVRYIVFKDGATWYAVALEFNIVESGDDPREVLMLLFEAIQGYIKSAGKAKIRPHILNQKTDKEYEEMWAALKKKKRPKIKSPLSIYTFGQRPLTV